MFEQAHCDTNPRGLNMYSDYPSQEANKLTGNQTTFHNRNSYFHAFRYVLSYSRNGWEGAVLKKTGDTSYSVLWGLASTIDCGLHTRAGPFGYRITNREHAHTMSRNTHSRPGTRGKQNRIQKRVVGAMTRAKESIQMMNPLAMAGTARIGRQQQGTMPRRERRDDQRGGKWGVPIPVFNKADVEAKRLSSSWWGKAQRWILLL